MRASTWARAGAAATTNRNTAGTTRFIAWTPLKKTDLDGRSEREESFYGCTTSTARNCVREKTRRFGLLASDLTLIWDTDRLTIMATPSGSYAVVRGVPETFDRAIKPRAQREAIDVRLARQQHERYCQVLEGLGLGLIRLEADDRYPDCCYVEDTAIVVGEMAIMAEIAAPSRRGEGKAVEAVLRKHKEISHLEPPATLDGGDVLRIGRRLIVGLSERTNSVAVRQLQEVLAGGDWEIVAVEVSGVLHLKSACSYLGEDQILLLPGHFDEGVLTTCRKILVPANEAHAANCLALNGRVLIPAGAPGTRSLIEQAGFATQELDISESMKAAGGLTCSSIVL
jgi:dimethylargininase